MIEHHSDPGCTRGTFKDSSTHVACVQDFRMAVCPRVLMPRSRGHVWSPDRHLFGVWLERVQMHLRPRRLRGHLRLDGPGGARPPAATIGRGGCQENQRGPAK
eukprot:10922080-Alexandrium_andersonii.AAC.1